MGNNIDVPASLQSLLDAISATRGSVLYRGAASWAALAPGTATYVLQTGGAGADPSWVAQSGGGSGAVVAVKFVTKTDTQSTTSTNGTFVNLTGLSITYTPTSASNRIVLIAALVGSGTTTQCGVGFRIAVDGGMVGAPTPVGSRTPVHGEFPVPNNADVYNAAAFQASYIPGNTSAHVYTVQFCALTGAGGSAFVNRSENDTNAAYTGQGSSTFTLMEVTP